MMHRNNTVSFMLSLLIFCLVSASILYFPQETSAGVSNGINYSLEILLPSLFPFMFLVSFALSSGLADTIGNAISGFTERVLSLPGAAGVTVLLSLIGGYPVGAVGISELLRKKKITVTQAQRMLLFCVNPGPAFLVNTIGISMLNNQRAGIVLLCANTVSAIIIGVITGLLSRKKQLIAYGSKAASHEINIPYAVITAVRSACGNCVSMCSLVVLFSGFSKVILSLIPFRSEMYKALTRSFLEITDGASALCRINCPIYIIAAAAAWGGICVHLQIMAAAPEFRAVTPGFFAGRFAMAALSAGSTYLICKYIYPDIEVFSNVKETSGIPFSIAPNSSIMLFLCCVMFLIFIMPSRSRADGITDYL